MKIILDTNVFVSGVYFSGPPASILCLWREGRFELVLSGEIFEEYRRVGEVLARDYPGVDLAPILELVAVNCEIVAAPPLLQPVASDPDDDKFLACALAVKAPVIVSGDKHLLAVSGWRGIEVVTPRRFVDRHLRTA